MATLVRSTTTVPIEQTEAATTEVVAASAGDRITLHGLVGSMSADGTLVVASDTTALTGVMPIAAKVTGAHIPLTANRNLCLKTATGEALNITTETGAFTGYAVISVGTD